MRTALGVTALAFSVLASAPSTRGADAPRQRPITLSVSPARIAVTGAAARVIVLRNPGSRSVALDATEAHLGTRSSASWLSVMPRRLVLTPHATARLTLRVDPPRVAEPGRHAALVLLTTRPLEGARVAVRARLGLVVDVRIPGSVSRELRFGRLRVLRTRDESILSVALLNRGKVTEELSSARITVSIVRRTRVIAVVRMRAADVRPGDHVFARASLGTSLHGAATAVVAVAPGRGLPRLERSYPVRL
jgi:hypothetical protein